MFKDWAEVQSCHHQTKRCRITQVANWDTDIPAQNHMAVITNSWVSNNENVRIADDHAVGILTLIWEKELHYDSCTPEAKKAIDFYNEQHADGPEYCHPPQKARHFENVKAPEITLHAEFNNTVKNQNFAFAVGYNVDPQPYLDWYFSLDEDVREARHKEIFTSANFFHWSKEACKMTVDMDDSGDLEHLTPIRKFYDWCHVDYTNKENWWQKDEYTCSFMSPRIVSIKYDQRFRDDWQKVFGEHGPNLEHPSGDRTKRLHFRQDYSIGNGYRVMNWETHKSIADVHTLDWKWDEFGKNWDKMKDITRGTVYPGLICTYEPETDPVRIKIAADFCDAGDDDHNTIIKPQEGQLSYTLGPSNYAENQRKSKITHS